MYNKKCKGAAKKPFCHEYLVAFRERYNLYHKEIGNNNNQNYDTRNTDKTTLFHTKHNFLKNPFSIEWNKSDTNLRIAASLSVFNLISFIR